MKTFAIIMQQEGGGCDYTIGCGINVSYFKAESMEAMVKRVHDSFVGDLDEREWGHASDTEMVLSSIEILEVVESVEVPLDAWVQEWTKKQTEATIAANEEKERAELERLSKKFGRPA